MFGQIRADIGKRLEKASGEKTGPDDIKDSQVADLCSPIAFKLAREWKKSPQEIADELSGKIEVGGYIKDVSSEKGYLNFYLDYSKMLPYVLESVGEQKDSYGSDERKKERIILEHTSINPSGPVHIGRLRNSLIGDCLKRILRFNGYDVDTHYYVNDIGKQIAIIAQGFYEGLQPDKDIIGEYDRYKDKEDFQVFFMYVCANKRFEEDSSFAGRVQERIKNAEEGDVAALESITDVAKKCLDGQKKIYSALDISFDAYDFESKYIRDGSVKKVLEFLSKTEYAKTNENGFGLDLSDLGLERRGGLSMLARLDGTSVYLARDIAYHLEKSGAGARMINVLGEDHKFEFQELRAILSEIYSLKTPLDVVHFSFVSFEGLELSTRKGQTAPVDKLIDEATSKAEEEIEKRGIAEKDIAPDIALGAIKYHILKTAPLKQIAFRWEDALSFEGEASPYIQYAHARCCSILSKAGAGRLSGEGEELAEHEAKLLDRIARFPETVKQAGEELKPNIIASYLYELSSSFSRFYKECPVLSAEKDVRERRLLLVDATRQVLKNGLALMGIRAPERM